MKILYITTIGGTMGFFKSLISELIKEGNIVDIATNEETSRVPDCYREWGCKIYSISTSRSPFSFGNIKAVKQIRSIAKNYDIVHCHTPLAGMATRFACRRLRKKQGLRVIYTAHGFHFYKGAPKKNWMIYFPVEKICSKWTDVLITINKEDYELAKKKMKAKRIEYVPGVGIDTKKFANTAVDRDKKREDLGIPNDAYLILSVGELNINKNHRAVIEAIGKLSNENIHYMIAGYGKMADELEKLSKQEKVNLHLLGTRNDVPELLKCCDLYILPSLREGLNVSLLEALASNVNAIASKIRGNVDLLDENNLFNPKKPGEIARLIMGRSHMNKINILDFDVSQIILKMKSIYFSGMNCDEQ